MEQSELKQITKLNLTENQIKVIKDKYLKDSPTIEDWIKLVSHNIVLAEILNDPDTNRDELFKDVNCEIINYESKGKIKERFFFHTRFNEHNAKNKNFMQFVSNLEKIYLKNSEKYKEIEDKFYEMISTFKFLPNSPCLMNAGRDLQQLSACYVLPVEDSIDGIYTSVKNMALIHQSGGGTGFSFSRLRPSGDRVKTTKGISSGPVTFMEIFDKSTDVVKQGGTRRGANMGILHYTHPQILDFIDAKKDNNKLENFNISVSIDQKFIKLVQEDKDYDLINPRNGEIVGKLNAKNVWKKLVYSAWETGDPGILMMDRINNSNCNATPQLGEIVATNPCGEQPLLSYESCNLGSINLLEFIDEENLDFDWDKLKKYVALATRFLDNMIDMTNYPIPEIEKMSKMTRRIGLGVMGWAESLVKLGLPYNDKRAISKAKEVMKFINVICMRASEEIAEERGVFPAWRGSVFDKDSRFFRGEEYFPRNSARTTIAPTGTIAITAGLQGAGIEPFFAIVYVRYNAAGIDALKKGEKPLEKDTFFEINPLFEEIAKANNYFGLQKEELYMKVNNNHKSLVGIKEIPKEIQNLFLTAHDLNPEEHVLMQCAFQEYVDNAVSKTVNLRNEATVEDVEKVYILAFENGAKGVTVYRDGCKQFQILNINEKKQKEEKKEEALDRSKLEEFSDYHAIETGHGTIHIHINYDEIGPKKIFANLTPTGTEISGLATALAIVLSKYFELGGEPTRIIKHLNSVKSERPYGFGQNRIDSIPHAISVALRKHLIKTGKIKTVDTKNQVLNNFIPEKITEETMYCQKCFSSNVGMTSGCSEPTCFDCGYSKCS